MKSIVVLLTLFSLCQDTGGCPTGFISSQNSNRCYFISDNVATFGNAQKYCESKNSLFAPVFKSEEQDDLSRVLSSQVWKCHRKKDCMEFWIHIYRANVWKTGEYNSIGPSFWDKGFPRGNGNCAYMNFQDNSNRGTWRNDDCNRQLKYVCIACPYGFTYEHGTNECLYLNTNKMNWNDARKACTELSPFAQLASIKDMWEMNSLASFLLRKRFQYGFRGCSMGGLSGKNNAAWIGGQTQDPQRCGTPFVWKPIGLDETPFSYAFWAPGNPNCKENREFCVRIGTGDTTSFNWDDAPCDQPNCSICKFK